MLPRTAGLVLGGLRITGSHQYGIPGRSGTPYDSAGHSRGMTMFTRLVAVAFAVLLGAGCAPAPTNEDVQAKAFAPPAAGSANVYVYRNERLGGVVRMAVSVDSKQVGLTQGMTYLLLKVPPGVHTIASQ